MLNTISNNIKYIYRAYRKAQSGLRNNLKNNRIEIPRGRHTYGPDPVLVGTHYAVKQLYPGSHIGNFCALAFGLKFLFRGKHNTHWVTTFPFEEIWNKNKHNEEIDPAPIIIGHDVWIATNVSIMQGVTVGNGAVIAQESLVTKDVPPYAIVGGHPAKIIRYRFSEKQIEDLLKIAWWHWEDELIKKCVPMLLSENIDNFIHFAKKEHENLTKERS